jgi:hypothetical protein
VSIGTSLIVERALVARRIGLGSVHLDLELNGGKSAADGPKIAESWRPAPSVARGCAFLKVLRGTARSERIDLTPSPMPLGPRTKGLGTEYLAAGSDGPVPVEPGTHGLVTRLNPPGPREDYACGRPPGVQCTSPDCFGEVAAPARQRPGAR